MFSKNWLSSKVFISYCHVDGFEIAELVTAKLQNKGYNVFLDTKLHQGKFDEQLYDEISDSCDFVIIVTPGLLRGYANVDSWVYKETLYALEKGKNIIPVLSSEVMDLSSIPPVLRELCRYQDVKLDQRRLFNASVEILMSYLKAKPNLKLLKNISISILFLSVGIIGLTYGLKIMSKPICIDQATSMTVKLGNIHSLLKQAKEIRDGWAIFYQQFQLLQNDPTARKDLVGIYQKELEHQKEQINLLDMNNVIFSLNTYEVFMLQVNGIKKSEVEALHNVVYPLAIQDMRQYLELLKGYIELGSPSMSLNMNVNQYDYILHSSNSYYYNYMALMVKMPVEAKDVYKEISKKWSEFPINKHANCTSEDYEHLANIEVEKMGEDLTLLSGVFNMQALELDKETAKFDSLSNRYVRVITLNKDVTEKRDSLAKSVVKLVALQKKIIKDCEFTPEDSITDKGSKILRLASILNDKIKSEMVTPDLTPDLTSLDVLQEINKRFDCYEREYPNDDLHIMTLKYLYIDAQKSLTPLTGVLYVGTKTGESHPILQIGDIIIERNGRRINSSEDFREAKKLSSTDTLTFLHLENDKLVWLKKSNPKNDLLIGLLKIKL